MLIGFILLILFLVTLVLPWVQLTRMSALRREITLLRDQVTWLIARAREKGETIPEQWDRVSRPAPLKPPPQPIAEKKVEPVLSEKAPTTKPTAPVKKPESLLDKKINFEQKYFVSLPVWIGGIALALAGAFLVKYSIEMGFLSPAIRITIGCLFGIGLLVLGHWIHDRPQIANGERIAQALSGAGIADLYVCLFAATSFYQLLPSSIGFIGMGVVTAIAVVLSLKQGPPIAMLGMVGGFITPALIESTEPNAPLLFIYLYFLLAGLFAVIWKKNWWSIAIPVVVGAYGWVFLWLGTSYTPSDDLSLGLFLIAVSATIVFFSKKTMEENEAAPPKTFNIFPPLNYLSLGGAIILMSAIATRSNFGAMEWGLFGCLGAGGMVLAYYNQKLYGFIPWLSVIMNINLLLSWQESDPAILASTLVGFAFLYTIGSYWLMWRSPKPQSWAILAAGSSLTYYVLAYAKFHNWLEGKIISTQEWYMDAHFWGVLAFVLFGFSVAVVVQVLNQFKGVEEIKQRLLTAFTLTATAFLSIGLSLELSSQFFTIALATEILAISWINGYVHIKALRFLAGLLAVFFTILIIPQLLWQIFLLSNNFVAQQTNLYFNLPENTLPAFWETRIPSVNWSFFHLAIPAVMFGLSSLLLRRQKDDGLIKAFEMTAIGLLAVMAYYFTRHAFHIHENLAFAGSSFTERGVVTNIYFLYGLACLWAGGVFKREGVFLSGLGLVGLSLFRILFWDLLVFNPLWSSQQVGHLPLLNSLLLVYGLPILWLSLVNKELMKTDYKKYLPYTTTCLFLLGFFFISFNVRQLFQGSTLDKDIMSNAEIYTYSVAWLLVGIGLLFFGTLKQDRTLRIASLAFMILSIGKVFLYDASELTGLLRVFSFLGLGISLIGLSWFYTRFVFKRLD